MLSGYFYTLFTRNNKLNTKKINCNNFIIHFCSEILEKLIFKNPHAKINNYISRILFILSNVVYEYILDRHFKRIAILPKSKWCAKGHTFGSKY